MTIIPNILKTVIGNVAKIFKIKDRQQLEMIKKLQPLPFYWPMTSVQMMKANASLNSKAMKE